MSNTPNPETNPDRATVYRIRIKGQLDQRWTAWFAGLEITPDDQGNTVLSGPVIDQAELHGLLRRVRDLGLPLLSVVQVDRTHDVTSETRSPSDPGS